MNMHVVGKYLLSVTLASVREHATNTTYTVYFAELAN